MLCMALKHRKHLYLLLEYIRANRVFSISWRLLKKIFQVKLSRSMVEGLNVVVSVWGVEADKEPQQPLNFLRKRGNQTFRETRVIRAQSSFTC